MTVKQGDIVFVTQAHHNQPVAAIVMSEVTSLDDVRVHVVSSSDPYALITVKHRQYADDAGYLEADETEPTATRPKETKNADAPEELSEGGSEESDDEGDGSGLVPKTEGSSEESEEVTDGDEGPFDVEPDQDEDDESEEVEETEEVSSSEQDGKPVPTTRGKRSKGRKR